MSRKINTSRPLSDADRAYLLSRGREQELHRIDTTTVELDEDNDPGPEDPGAPETPEDELPDYDEMTVDQLKAEIDARNEGVDPESDEYVKPEGKNKPQLIAALVADDEAHA